LARYNLKSAARTLGREALRARPQIIGRYSEGVPGQEPVSLGEGMTPIIHARRLGRRMALDVLWIKDEGLNPTGSFKARGMAGAVTSAEELGAKVLAAHAGGAPAAHATQAEAQCVTVMSANTPADVRRRSRRMRANRRSV
jgi:threonine synthase